MKISCRAYAALELIALFALWTVAVWSPVLFRGASLWGVVAFVLSVAIILLSLKLRRPGWLESGFRLDNVFTACVPVGFATLLVIGAIAIASHLLRLEFHPIAREGMVERQVANFLARGIAQEAFFLGYLFHRWKLVLKSSVGAVFANAITFSFIHLPAPLFVAMTAAGGIFFGSLFLKTRNVLVIGIAHGVIALCVLSVFRQGGVLESMRIGPPQLTPITSTIGQEIKKGDRIGMGTHALVSEQFGDLGDAKIEKIGGKWNIDNDRVNQERITAFLNSDGRVFLAISERDFNRLPRSLFKQKPHVLDKQYIWKRKVSFGDLLSRAPLSAFRDYVLLVSNRGGDGS